MQETAKVRPAAIITGGATGVGRATALALARRGYAVLINYSRSRDEAEATRGEIASLDVPALAFQADVADDGACRAMVAAAVNAFGRVDLLVNSAGTTRFIAAAELEEVTDDIWQRIMAVNVVGPFHCARAVTGPMRAGGGGQIINISSAAAFSARGNSIPYTASKAALNNLTVALARTLAPDIRVNAVAPGFIDGRWVRQGYGETFEAARRGVERRTPLGKVCMPDDVAEAIVALATGSSMVTGQIVVCDGGALLGA